MNTTAGTKTRISYIDKARGFALFLLVLGHIVRANSLTFNWIFSFHVPLFFVLSGMCSGSYPSMPFGSYLKHKAKARLLPFVIITLIGLGICMLIPPYREAVLADGLKTQLISAILRAQPVNLYIGQVWYFASLFWAELYFYLWYRLTVFKKAPGIKTALLQVAGIAVILIIARNMWRIRGVIPVIGRLPFHMDSAFMSVFCYIIGYYISTYRILDRIRRFGGFLILPLIALNLYFGTWLNGYVNLCDFVYGNSLYYFIAMLSGVMAVLLISYYLPDIKLLLWYGRNTLPLFASHTFLIYLVRELVFLITGTHYTMMGEIPLMTAVCIAVAVIILFLPVGALYGAVKRLFHKPRKKPQERSYSRAA